VLLLADVFEAFRHTIIDAHGLNCLHFPSLPSMTLQLALKVIDVELELITDPDIHLMIESAIRGALSYVAQRYALANFPAMSDYRSDLPTSHLLYIDCNSLYTMCQMYPLPVGGFRFLTNAELLAFDVASVPANLPTGYFVKCDLCYPAKLHALHNAYPRAPEHMYIVEEMLSDTVRLMQDVTGVAHFPCTKLLSNLRNKTCYVTHYVVCSSILPTDSYWTRFTASSHSLSARTCCRLSNFATTVGKMRSLNSSRRCTI